MQEALDPYTPGAGRTPVAMVGRDEDIAALDVLIARTANLLPPARPMLLTGLRGTGKTVLLNAMAQRVEQERWPVVQLEATQGRKGAAGARQALAGGLAKAALWVKGTVGLERATTLLATITSFSLSVGLTSISLGVERDPARASTGSLELDLRDVVAEVCEALAGKPVALAVFIDEMQDLDDELLAALITTQHQASQRGWPFYVIGAGLPSLPGRLAEVKSYAERMFEVRHVDALSQTEACQALTEPVERMGVRYEPAALDHLVHASGCYPYFLQEMGSAMWRVAPGSPFTVQDALAAEKEGLAQLDSMFFASRWERATPAEREYLAAMAAQGEEACSSAVVAAHLGKSLGSLGPARANLINKGLVYAPQRGQVAFTVPGFARYVARRHEVEA